MRVAIVGCAHGELDDMYATITHINTNVQSDDPIRLLLCCGDFQSVRNSADLSCLACPVKYRRLGSFHHYYSGAKPPPPVLTIFIGGNHEASNYLQELQYGGWVAPNIFYLGSAGVVNFCGLRIGGISGIYKPNHYTRGHFESYPYDNSTMRSVYHMREYEVHQMAHISTDMDVFLSHDWPRGIEQSGDVADLLRKKNFFLDEIQSNTLGNPATEFLLYKIKPSYWFSAHLHVKYPAIVQHPPQIQSQGSTEGTASVESDKQQKTTKFLALDKCLPRKDFMQVLSFDTTEDASEKLCVDLEWLAILRKTHSLSSKSNTVSRTPQTEESVSADELEYVKNALKQHNPEDPLAWPTEFSITAPPYNSNGGESNNLDQPLGSPQTDLLLNILGLEHRITVPYALEARSVSDPNSVDIDDI